VYLTQILARLLSNDKLKSQSLGACCIAAYTSSTLQSPKSPLKGSGLRVQIKYVACGLYHAWAALADTNVATEAYQ